MAEHGKRAADHGIDDELREAFWDLMHSDEVWRQEVHALCRMDVVLPSDWPRADSNDGMSCGLANAQVKFKSPMSDQLVPADVHEVEDQMRRALQLRHPLHEPWKGFGPEKLYEHRRAAELIAATRFTVQAGADGPRQMRERTARMRLASQRLWPLSTRARVCFGAQHLELCPLPLPHSAFVAALVTATSMVDLDAPLRILRGCPVAGDLPPVGSWNRCDVPRPLGLSYDDLPHAQWNDFLARDAEARFRKLDADGLADHNAMWEKSIEERDAGFAEGPLEIAELDRMFGRGTWRASRRFAIWQKGKLRVIDDDAENLGNAATSYTDKLATQSADFPAQCAAGYQREVGAGVGGWSAALGTEDVQAFYRVVFVGTRAYTVVIIVNPRTGRAAGFALWGFNFGKLAAVLYSNAVAVIGASSGRRLIGAVVDHYFDDFAVVPLTHLGGLEIEGALDAAQEGVSAIMECMGYGFSAKKHERAALCKTFGGVEADFSALLEHGRMRLAVNEARKASIAKMSEECLVRCRPLDAASLRGKVWFTTTWTMARALRAVLQPLTVRASSSVDLDYVPEPLRDALEFLRDVVPMIPPVVIDLQRPRAPPVLVWSDAMFEAGAELEDGGGWVVLVRKPGAAPVFFVSFGATPVEVRRAFVEGKKTYIGQLEFLWGHSPYASVPGEFVGQLAIHFIDNTSAVSGFVKGYARPVDSAMIVHGQAATCVALGCTPFYYYVRSSANVADLPSRFAVAELTGVLARLGLGAEIVFVDPVHPDLRSWRLSARAWLLQMGVSGPAPRSLQSLRGEWRHLVRDVHDSSWRAGGAVYVGRSPAFGPTKYGNRVAPVDASRLTSRAKAALAHERAVRAYALWLGQPERAELRARMSRRLRGRPLACHCSGRGLACHAEVIAVVANAAVPTSVLLCEGCA